MKPFSAEICPKKEAPQKIFCDSPLQGYLIYDSLSLVVMWVIWSIPVPPPPPLNQRNYVYCLFIFDVRCFVSHRETLDSESLHSRQLCVIPLRSEWGEQGREYLDSCVSSIPRDSEDSKRKCHPFPVWHEVKGADRHSACTDISSRLIPLCSEGGIREMDYSVQCTILYSCSHSFRCDEWQRVSVMAGGCHP